MKPKPKPAKGVSQEYLAGYDSGVNGPNETNCNFRLFATPEQTKEWERGRFDADSGFPLLAKPIKK